MEWIPIEECKDEGKEFLITGFNQNCESNGRWITTGKMHNGEWYSVDNPDVNYHQPTHFMPIPELPKKRGER